MGGDVRFLNHVRRDVPPGGEFHDLRGSNESSERDLVQSFSAIQKMVGGVDVRPRVGCHGEVGDVGIVSLRDVMDALDPGTGVSRPAGKVVA